MWSGREMEDPGTGCQQKPAQGPPFNLASNHYGVIAMASVSFPTGIGVPAVSVVFWIGMTVLQKLKG